MCEIQIPVGRIIMSVGLIYIFFGLNPIFHGKITSFFMVNSPFLLVFFCLAWPLWTLSQAAPRVILHVGGLVCRRGGRDQCGLGGGVRCAWVVGPSNQRSWGI